LDKACLYSHCDPSEDSHTDLVVVVVDERNLLGCTEELESLLGGLKLASDTYFQSGEVGTDCYQDSKSRLMHVAEKASNCHHNRVHSNSRAVALLHSLEICQYYSPKRSEVFKENVSHDLIII